MTTSTHRTCASYRAACQVSGGPIGVELAQAMQRLGAQVTLVHYAGRLLDKEDPSISAVLDGRLRAESIALHLEAEVASFASAAKARTKPRHGDGFGMAFDIGYVATGRVVSFEGL